MLLTTTAITKSLYLFAGIPIHSHGIEGFTDQQTAFTHAHAGLILQSRNFNLRLEHGRKSAYP